MRGGEVRVVALADYHFLAGEGARGERAHRVRSSDLNDRIRKNPIRHGRCN